MCEEKAAWGSTLVSLLAKMLIAAIAMKIQSWSEVLLSAELLPIQSSSGWPIFLITNNASD